MKIRSLLCGLFAIAAISACNQEEPVVNPSLDVSKTSAAVEAEGGEVTVEVTSNVEWTAKADQDWVTVSPASGNGSEKAVAVKLNVEPNEAEEARTATVTISAEKLSKTVKVTQAGKTVTPGPEPKPEVAWSMMGCFVDNQWASDVPMAQEGEWIVAKGAQFTELTFKIRGNASWDDATNIGYAPGTEKGLVNAKLSVVTAEYSKANLGGDAADIKLNGVAGTYDVYFSFEKLEVYVMEEGYKPGEREPVPAEPKDVTYTVTGTIADHAWENNYEGGLMVAEGDYFVAKNVPFVWNSTLYGGEFNVIELKIVETGTWDAYAYPEKDVMQQVNTEVSLIIGGENVAFAAPEGTYDVYFDKANAKLWVMNAGYKPGETPEPEPAEYDIDGKQWVFTWEALGVPAVFDLGVTAPGAFYFAYDMSAFGDEYAGVWYPFYSGAYTIEKTDGTSGVINVVLIDPYEGTELSAAIPYTMSSENEATFDTSALKAQLEVTSVTATPASEVIDLTGGGQENDYLADGDYWIVSGGKVATPVTSSGALQTVDAVDGRSTAANAFTFRMIDEAEMLYSIKDANGMYLYLEASGNFGTSAAIDYKNDAFCWQIYPMGDGTYYIANYNTMGTVQLASDNSFVCVEDMVGVYPELILAENPVEDQPGETGVKTIFEGPFDASWDNAMSALSYDGYDWSTAKVGDIIKIYGHPTSASAGSWYGMNFRTGEGWAAFTEVPDQFNTPTTVAVKITQTTYDELVTKHGFVVVGTGYTVDKIELIPADLEASSFDNMIGDAGTFESQDISMIGCWGENSPSVALSAAGEGYGGGYALVLKNPVDGGQYNSWKAQAAVEFTEVLDPSKTYVMSFYVKASVNATIGVQYQNASYSNQGGNMSFVALNNWVYVEHEFTTGDFNDIMRLLFNFGESEADFYIDNFKFGPKK